MWAVSSLPSVSDEDLELALERVGERLLVASLLFELGDLAHRFEVPRVDLVQDEKVPLDRAVDVVQRLGEKLRLAKRDPHLVFRPLGQLDQATEKVLRLLSVAALLGIVGEEQERVGVVAVFECLEQRFAGAVLVAEALGLDRGGLLAERRALDLVVDLLGSRDVEIGQIGETLGVGVTQLDLARVLVVVRIERRSPPRRRAAR